MDIELGATEDVELENLLGSRESIRWLEYPAMFAWMLKAAALPLIYLGSTSHKISSLEFKNAESTIIRDVLFFLDASKMSIAALFIISASLWQNSHFWVFDEVTRASSEKAVIFVIGFGLWNTLLMRVFSKSSVQFYLFHSLDISLDLGILIMTLWFLRTQSGPINIVLSFTGFQFIGSLNDADLKMCVHAIMTKQKVPKELTGVHRLCARVVFVVLLLLLYLALTMLIWIMAA